MLTPILFLLIIALYCLQESPYRDVRKASNAQNEANIKALEYLYNDPMDHLVRSFKVEK